MELKSTIKCIVEHIHQVLEDRLQAYHFDHEDVDQDDDPFNEYKAAKAHAICSAFHQTHGHAQTQLVYGRDMFYQLTARLIGRKRLQENKRKFTRRMNKKTKLQKRLGYNDTTGSTRKNIGD